MFKLNLKKKTSSHLDLDAERLMPKVNIFHLEMTPNIHVINLTRWFLCLKKATKTFGKFDVPSVLITSRLHRDHDHEFCYFCCILVLNVCFFFVFFCFFWGGQHSRQHTSQKKFSQHKWTRGISSWTWIRQWALIDNIISIRRYLELLQWTRPL